MATNIYLIAVAINGLEFVHVAQLGVGLKLLIAGIAAEYVHLLGLSFLAGECKVKLFLPTVMMSPFVAIDGRQSPSLGIGDLVIPSLLIVFLYRFDLSRPRKASYFKPTMAIFLITVAAVLVADCFVIRTFSARLILFPIVAISALGQALIRGELSELLNYSDYPKEDLEAERHSLKQD